MTAASFHVFEAILSYTMDVRWGGVGLQVLSASSSGESGESCQLDLQLGTSMAAPVR